jgi:hypothetical protein
MLKKKNYTLRTVFVLVFFKLIRFQNPVCFKYILYKLKTPFRKKGFFVRKIYLHIYKKYKICFTK